MKSDVFFVSAAPTSRNDKKSLDANIRAALDESMAKHPGARVVALEVSADIVSNFQKALVVVVYDDTKYSK